MLAIHLLGQFKVRRSGADVTFNSRPAQSLFSYLALHPNTAHRRELLAGLLWPDSVEANARRNLRQALWQVRRALNDDELVLSDDLTVTLRLPFDAYVDVAEVLRPVEPETPPEVLQAAVEVYAGELLPGFYDEWVSGEREHVRAQLDAKAAALLDRLLAAGRWPDVLASAERWIALGGTPEAAYRALMRAHAALSDTARMAEAYRRCTEALRGELGVEPSQATRTLFDQLSRGGGALRSPELQPLVDRPRHNLPLALTSFIGREKELNELERVLRLADTRLLTLTGPGGTGKTRLAIQAATLALEDFPDGVWLIELASLSNADLIAQAVAATLDVREQPSQPIVRTLVDQLRTRSLLIILDNCEHLVEASAGFAEVLLRACPRVKVMCTSRETLGVAGETVFRVPSLSLPEARQLLLVDELPRYESVRLFVERARAVRPAFALTDANAAAVVQICRRLDGVPLAIELAAARMQSMSAEQIADRLDDRFRLLTGGNRAALPRQQTLRALIDWSWDLLADDERALLRRLSVFVDGWSLGAAEGIFDSAVAEAAPIENPADVLSRLVEKSLVVAEPDGAETRYRLLETIRQYAQEKLFESGEVEPTRTAHLSHYLSLAEAAEPRLRSADQLTWLARLEDEHDNLRAALQWAVATEDAVSGLRLAGSLARFWYLRGYWTEGREWLSRLLRATPVDKASPPALISARMRALCGAGWLADEDGSEQAWYAEARALSQQVGDRWSEAFATRGAVASFLNWTNTEVVAVELQRSLALFRDVGDVWGRGLAQYNLGWLALDGNGDVALGRAYWEDALANFRQSGDRWGIAVTLNSLGYVERIHGNYTRAIELADESLSLFQALGDKAGIGMSLNRLASVALRRGDFAEAASLLQESLEVQHELGDPMGVIDVLELWGLILIYQGRNAEAEAMLRDGLAKAQEIDARRDVPYFLRYLGFSAYCQKDFARAEVLWLECIPLHRATTDGEVPARFGERGLGLIALRQGEVDRAAQMIELAWGNMPAEADRRTRAIASRDWAELALAQGEHATAREHLREAVLLNKKIGDRLGMARSIETASRAVGDLAASARLIGAAQALRAASGAPVPPVEQGDLDQRITELRAALGAAAFESARSDGERLTIDAAAKMAMAALVE